MLLIDSHADASSFELAAQHLRKARPPHPRFTPNPKQNPEALAVPSSALLAPVGVAGRLRACLGLSGSAAIEVRVSRDEAGSLGMRELLCAGTLTGLVMLADQHCDCKAWSLPKYGSFRK